MIVNARFIALNLVLLLSGCACEKQLDEITETDLTTQGGVAQSFDGLLELHIPPGALDRNATITIETLRELQPQNMLSPAYRLHSSAGDLRAAGHLQIKIMAKSEAALAQIEGGAPMIVTGSAHDALQQIVSAQITSMSTYCAVGHPIHGPDAGIKRDAGEQPDAEDPSPDATEHPDAEEDAGEPDAEEIADAEDPSPDAEDPSPDAEDPNPDAEPDPDATEEPDAEEIADAGEDPDADLPDLGELEDGGISCVSDGPVAAMGIDLYLACHSPPVGPWPVGSTQPLNIEIGNSGNMDSGQFDVLFVLSTNMIIRVTDIAILTVTSSSVPANSTSMLSTTVTIPAAIAPGSYYLGVILDSGSVVPETRESNNIAIIGPVSIVP